MTHLGTRIGPSWHSCFDGKENAEIDTCLNCPLPDCVGRENPRCPLRAAELEPVAPVQVKPSPAPRRKHVKGELSDYVLQRIAEAADRLAEVR